MTRQEFEELVRDRYGVCADYPFVEDFTTGVFRHGNGKWFALAMYIKEKRIGLSGDAYTDVVNLKAAPEIVESMVGIEKGVYRAYHMNKVHWLTVRLSECSDSTVKWLLRISYEATRPHSK